MNNKVLDIIYWNVLRLIILISIILIIIQIDDIGLKLPNEKLIILFNILFRISLLCFTYRKLITWLISFILIIPTIVFDSRELIGNAVNNKSNRNSAILIIQIACSIYIIVRVSKYLLYYKYYKKK